MCFERMHPDKKRPLTVGVGPCGRAVEQKIRLMTGRSHDGVEAARQSDAEVGGKAVDEGRRLVSVLANMFGQSWNTATQAHGCMMRLMEFGVGGGPQRREARQGPRRLGVCAPEMSSFGGEAVKKRSGFPGITGRTEMIGARGFERDYNDIVS